MGGEQGSLRAPALKKPQLEATTNPFPNLSLVSVGQDVDVWLQGAGFDDHFVPGVMVVGGGVGWGRGTQLLAQPVLGLSTFRASVASGQLCPE